MNEWKKKWCSIVFDPSKLLPVCRTQNPEAGSDLLGSNSFVSYAGTVSIPAVMATKTTATETKDKTRFLLLLFSLSFLSLFPPTQAKKGQVKQRVSLSFLVGKKPFNHFSIQSEIVSSVPRKGGWRRRGHGRISSSICGWAHECVCRFVMMREPRELGIVPGWFTAITWLTL